MADPNIGIGRQGPDGNPLFPLWQLSGWGVPTRSEGIAHGSLHASWLHLHWSGQPRMPQRLVAAARGVEEGLPMG